jgi:RNA polymerase sigma-70 factor (ECF subfamily)
VELCGDNTRIRKMNTMAAERQALNDETDEALIELVTDGDRGAFAELAKRHSKRYYRVAYRMVFNKNDAEDIAQEAFLKLWDKPYLWERNKHSKFSTWFYRVVVNLCIDRNRKKSPLRLKDGIEIVDNKASTVDSLDAQQKKQILKKLILGLPERQQVALNLCYYEGISNKEAADIMGVGLKALQSLLIRGKNTLREKTKQYCERG